METQPEPVDAGGCGCADPGTSAAGTCYCSVDDLVHAIARKHALSILNLLGAQGETRFAEVERALPRLGPSVLSDTLKELTRVGLVDRQVIPETPPRVFYSLTRSGRLLRDRFRELLDEVR